MLGYRWKVTSSISIKTRVIQRKTGDLTESSTRAPSETKSASLAIRDHRHEHALGYHEGLRSPMIMRLVYCSKMHATCTTALRYRATSKR